MSTKKEWCDITINPVVGCSKCSPGCGNCYAERFAARLAKNPKTAAKYAGVVDAQGKWTGKISARDSTVFDRLPQKPSRIFIGSMTDLFHRGVDDTARQAITTVDGTTYEFAPDTMHVRIAMVLAEIGKHPQHTFMFLTKRPEAMREVMQLMLNRPLPNLWLGVTVCNQAEADAKIPVLLETPAAKRFVSVEPMLGPINLGFMRAPTDRDYIGWNGDWPIDYVVTTRVDDLHWVICGGETGPGARPMHPDWVRDLRGQCAEERVPFFFKGWGEWVTENQAPEDIVLPGQSLVPHGWKGRKYEGSVYRVGKRRSGRLLDGREWNEVPA